MYFLFPSCKNFNKKPEDYSIPWKCINNKVQNVNCQFPSLHPKQARNILFLFWGLNFSLVLFSLLSLAWANIIIQPLLEGDVPGTWDSSSSSRPEISITLLLLLILLWSGNDHPPAFISSIRIVRPNMSGLHPSLSSLSFISM